MPEISRRISMTIDLKKNRLRIHRSTLRLMGFPPFVKLLFSQDQNAVAVINLFGRSCSTFQSGCFLSGMMPPRSERLRIRKGILPIASDRIFRQA